MRTSLMHLATMRACFLLLAAAATACTAAQTAAPPAATPPAKTAPAATPPATKPPATSQPSTKPPAATQPATTPPSSTPAQPELSVRITTVHGPFRIQLRTAEAPTACASFINLIQRGYYKGQTFNGWTRVIRQATGPLEGRGPGYGIRREFSPALFFDRPGMVALRRPPDADLADPTVFFITTKEQDRWNLEFPVFGVVMEGLSQVEMIQEGDLIQSMEILGDPAPLLARFANDITRWNALLDRALGIQRPAADTPAQPADKPAPPAGNPAPPAGQTPPPAGQPTPPAGQPKQLAATQAAATQAAATQLAA